MRIDMECGGLTPLWTARLDAPPDHPSGAVKPAPEKAVSSHRTPNRILREAIEQHLFFSLHSARREPRLKITMSVRVVRLGTPRNPGEGTRIGTVRRPPRGVPKAQFAQQNWYDVWFPNLAPSVETMKLGLTAETAAAWARFARKYKAEMASPNAKHSIDLLAVLSHTSNFSVGCYCENEARCHRSILKQLLLESGAEMA